MGVNTDGQDIGPGSSLTDGVEDTEKSGGFEQETGNEKSLFQDAEGDVGIQEPKMTKVTGILLITPLQNMPSHYTSGALDTEHNEAHREHTDAEDIVLSSTPTLLRPDAYIEDEKTELSQGALVNLNTDTSADDKCAQLGECTTPLQPGEIREILETDGHKIDDWDAMYNTLLDASAKLELPFNPNIDQLDEEGYTPLFEAALEGHLEGVNDLISRGANPNKPSKGGLRPLHAAARNGHAHIVDFLILQGADVSVECERGQTPLHTAAAKGYVDILESFTAEEANVNVKDNTGWTPFNAVVQHGHIEAVKYLLTKGANQNRYDGMPPLYAAAEFGNLGMVKFFTSDGADINAETDKGRIPLHGAAAQGHLKVMEYLIQQGSDVNKKDAKGWTPFNAAVQYGHIEAVKYLMTKGAMQNTFSGMTPLYTAALFGHLDIVEFFISNGDDVNEEDDDGRILIHCAAALGHVKVMEYLIQQGSEVNKGDANGWTPFNAAIQYGQLEAVKYLTTKGVGQVKYASMTNLFAAAAFGHLDIVKFFISTGADVNEEDDKGMIPLHGAAAEGHLKVMEYLIQQGSNVNKGDVDGWTPCNTAVLRGHLEAVKYLMTEGPEQNRFDDMTPLYAAAGSGHLDIVKFFISKGADVNKENDNGRIPLHGAAMRGHMKVIEYLIHQGSDVNKSDAKGWTPINAAVQEGHLEAVKYLMTQGAKRNRCDGMTPLYTAARLGHLDIVRFLVSDGADVNEEDNGGMIPLHRAAGGGHLKVMGYLIQQGSDVNKSDAKGWTPINAAVQEGHLEAVKCLMTKGAKQNRYDGMTPLYAAAQLGHLDIVRFFISKGADVNKEDDEGMTPLHGAAARGHLKVMEYLIHQGSNVNKTDNTGRTPFNVACQYGHPEAVKYLMTEGAKQTRYNGMNPLYAAAQFGHLDIVKLFIANGTDVNEEDDEGEIPLHGAAAEGQLKVIEYLIQQGSDLNKKDNTGWTPFIAAVRNGHLEVGKVLLAEGAQGTGFEGLTPLYIATQYEHVDVVKFLVSSGYDVNERNESGKSPLHAACYNGNMDIVKFLVYHNANVNEQDNDGWTHLHAAAQEGHQDIIDYLALNGADMHVRDVDVDSLTPLQAAANTTNPPPIEGISPSRGDPDEEEAGDPRSGGHQNIITRGYVTVTMKNEQTQLAYQVDNADEGYYCIQADILERGDDELSLKSLPTRTHDDEKADKEERNPLIQGKLRYHDEGEQDPMLDHKEAIKCIGIRGRDTITNSTDCSSPHAPQTWQYSGCDLPYLNTIETDAHPSVEPESRCHSLIDENREIRETSSTVNDGNDLSINETSLKRKSFPTHPPAVVHQKLYDGNPVSSQGTSSNPVWKIGTQRRTSVGRMIIALAIILAGSPILVAGIDSTDRVTLQAGQPGVVPFHFQWPPSDTSQVVPYYTVRFESNPLPFCINGKVDIKGFKNPSQLRRFSTSVTDLDTSPCVNLIIDNVDTLDEDRYLLTVVWHSFENVRYETIQKRVDVQTPPGRAKCFITLSENDDYAYEVHCETTTRSVTNTLSCFQNDRQIDVKGDITDNGLITRGIFLLPDNTYFSCCAHDITSHVSETMCNDFEWLNGKETKRQIVNTVPTSVTNPTPQEESHTGSGACRQFMLPSLWHFTYIFVNLLAFVTMY